MNTGWQDKLAVLYEGQGNIASWQNLASITNVPLSDSSSPAWLNSHLFYLAWRNGCLALLDGSAINTSGLTVEIDHRPGEQRSWPMAKTGALAQALGRKTQSIVDATAGWGQDALAMFRMGYKVQCIERSSIMAELLADGFRRLSEQDWMKQLGLLPPGLLVGNAIELLQQLAEPPDCIYLDPMFPPKRKKSALAKKSIMMLRDLVGDDLDKDALFAAALKSAGKRVVVKSPDYAEPLGGKPSASFKGKLLRYDVYLK
jgi:16S rRNA (guanine1516-N2)-methyltransferase